MVEPMNTWIPMSEQLPPVDSPVLIHTSDGTVCAACRTTFAGDTWWDGAGFDGYEWEWTWSRENEPWLGVTHWMPLPEPPRP